MSSHSNSTRSCRDNVCQLLQVNFIDTYFRTGLYPRQLPTGLGEEGAGVVEAVGPGWLIQPLPAAIALSLRYLMVICCLGPYSWPLCFSAVAIHLSVRHQLLCTHLLV